MIKKFAIISIAVLALTACQQNKRTPSYCTVGVGSTVVWKEVVSSRPDYHYTYFKYVPAPTPAQQDEQQVQQPEIDFTNAFCRVDNHELYQRLNIGDAVPWAYRGDFVIKR